MLSAWDCVMSWSMMIHRVLCYICWLETGAALFHQRPLRRLNPLARWNGGSWKENMSAWLLHKTFYFLSTPSHHSCLLWSPFNGDSAVRLLFHVACFMDVRGSSFLLPAADASSWILAAWHRQAGMSFEECYVIGGFLDRKSGMRYVTLKLEYAWLAEHGQGGEVDLYARWSPKEDVLHWNAVCLSFDMPHLQNNTGQSLPWPGTEGGEHCQLSSLKEVISIIRTITWNC